MKTYDQYGWFNKTKKKGRPKATLFRICCCGSALTGFEPALRLVDYIDAAFTAHDAAIAMTLLKRAEGIANFHGPSPSCRGAAMRRSCSLRPPKRVDAVNLWWTILGLNQ